MNNSMTERPENILRVKQEELLEQAKKQSNSAKYPFLDEKIIALLKEYYKDEQTLDRVEHQMNLVLGHVNKNINRYTFSKDYREAFDEILTLVSSGQLLI